MIYVDTSALVKRYLREPGSDTFDTFFLSRAPLGISQLTIIEMRCVPESRGQVVNCRISLCVGRFFRIARYSSNSRNTI